MSDNNKDDKKENNNIALKAGVFILVIWGLIGLIKGDGFFEAIFGNIKAVLIIGCMLIVGIILFNISSDK